MEEVPVEQLRLLEDRILCRVLKKPKNVGSLRVEHWEYDEKTNIGRVLAIGQTYEGTLKLGDYVIFEPWTGREIQSADETLILLRGPQIDGVIEL